MLLNKLKNAVKSYHHKPKEVHKIKYRKTTEVLLFYFIFYQENKNKLTVAHSFQQ